MKSSLRIAANALFATLEASLVRLLVVSAKQSRLLPLGLVLASGTIAKAATDTWSGATNTDWSASSNWNSGSGPVPGSGDTALFNTNVAQINNTVANQSVNTIDFGPGIPTTTITIGSTTGKQLILSNGGSIQTLPTLVTAGTININAPLVLTPNSTTTSGSYTFANYTGNSSADAVFNFGGPISAGTTTGSEVLNLLSTNKAITTTNTISGVISDGGAAGGVSLVQNGTSIWSLTAADTITGSVTVNAGLMQLTSSGSLNNISSVNVIGNGVTYGASGGALNGNLGAAGIFLLNDISTSINRLSSTTPINLNSGTFAIEGPTSSALTQSLGALTLVAGHSSFENFNGTTGGSLVTTLASVTRNNNATLTLFASGATALGSASNQILVTSDSNLLSGLIGGGGTAGSQTVSILPWVSYNGTDTSVVQGRQVRANNGFVTYTTAGGFRVLSSSEYATNLTSGTTTNVELTASTSLTSGSATINSLFLNGATANQTLSISPGATLNVTSGAIETPSANGTASFSMSINGGGTINFGSNPGYFTGNINGGLLTAALAGSGGMVFAPNGSINLNTAATYTGPTLVEGGTLGENIANALPSGTSLRIDAGALYIGAFNGGAQQVKSLSGTGTVAMGSTTTVLNVGTGTITGANETVTIGNGGTLTPGDPSGSLQAGTLTFGGGTGFSYTNPVNLSLLSGSTLVIDLASATQNGLVNLLNGSASISGGTLTIATLGSFSPTVGETWNIIDTTGGVTGTSLTPTAGYSLSIAGNNLVLTYIGVTPANAYFTGASSSDLNTTANYYTTGSGTTVPAGPPGSTTNLFLTANAGGASVLSPTLNTGNLTIASLTFTGTGTAGTSGVSLSGANTLTVGTSSGITVQSGSGADAISAPVALGASQTWTNASTGSLTVSGGITGTGSLAIANTSSGNTTISTGAVNFTGALANTGSGTGTTTISSNIGSNVTTVTENASSSPLVLSGSNSYTGGTTVTAGALYVNNTSGSGTGSGPVTVNGGTLAGKGTITAGTTSATGVTIKGGAKLASGVAQSSTSGTVDGTHLTFNNTLVTVGSSVGTANLTFDLGSGNSGFVSGNASYDSFANPDNNTTYLSLSGSSSINFAGSTSISLVDLTNLNGTGAGTLALRSGTPYLLIHAASNTDYLNLVINTGTALNPNYSLSQFDGSVNGYLAGIYTGGLSSPSSAQIAGNISLISISQFGSNGVTPLAANSTGIYAAPALYLDAGNLEVVPEPGSSAMMLGGLALLALHIRRRSKRN